MMIGVISLILLSNSATSLKLNIEPKLGKNESGQVSLTKPEEKGKPEELSKQGFEPFCLSIDSEKTAFTLFAGFCSSCYEEFEGCMDIDPEKRWDFKVNMTTKNKDPMLARQLRNRRLQYMLHSFKDDDMYECFRKLKKCGKESIKPLLEHMGLKFKYSRKLDNKIMKAWTKWDIDMGPVWDIMDAQYVLDNYEYTQEWQTEVTKCRDVEKWPKLELACEGCTALVTLAKLGEETAKTCQAYCESFGHVCVRSQMDYHDTCMPYWEMPCDYDWSVDYMSSDALCTCERA